MSRLDIGIVIITLNEADRIGRLLDSVSFADEIIVVDSGSSDDTRSICRQHGARVIIHDWQGYAAQKQFAMEQARSNWILNLDADEAVSEDLASEIFYALSNVKPDVNGFSMPRLSRYLNRWIRHGGWYPDRKIRLVKKGKARWTGEGLHEKLVVEGNVQDLSKPLLHYVYRNISDQIQTIDKFSTVYAGEYGHSGSLFVMAGVLHAIGKFAECYIWKLGFLDGIAGLIIAMNSSWYVFLKHAKRWELNNNE